MKISIFFTVIIVALFSCNEQAENKRPTNSMDVGRNFIRATLDGDFVAAEDLLLKDSLNIETFQTYINYYKTNLSADVKQGYKKASYNINKLEDINDSTVIINYSNTYMNKPTNIRIIKQNNLWSVDFKYTTGDTTSVK
jgi:hypothetical protein